MDMTRTGMTNGMVNILFGAAPAASAAGGKEDIAVKLLGGSEKSPLEKQYNPEEDMWSTDPISYKKLAFVFSLPEEEQAKAANSFGPAMVAAREAILRHPHKEAIIAVLDNKAEAGERWTGRIVLGTGFIVDLAGFGRPEEMSKKLDEEAESTAERTALSIDAANAQLAKQDYSGPDGAQRLEKTMNQLIHGVKVGVDESGRLIDTSDTSGHRGLLGWVGSRDDITVEIGADGKAQIVRVETTFEFSREDMYFGQHTATYDGTWVNGSWTLDRTGYTRRGPGQAAPNKAFDFTA